MKPVIGSWMQQALHAKKAAMLRRFHAANIVRDRSGQARRTIPLEELARQARREDLAQQITSGEDNGGS
jgi:hypothetical protein